MIKSLVVLCLLSSVTVLADDIPSSGELALTVEVGETKSIAVGAAKGLLCDDLTVMTPRLEGGETSNKLFVTGLKVGKTLCKVGTGRELARVLVTIKVVAKADAGAATSR